MKKLFSLILVLCMVMTACSAFADTTAGGSLSDLFGGLMSGTGSAGSGGLSDLFGGLMGGTGGGIGGGSLSDMFGGLVDSLGSGDAGGLGGLSGLFDGLMGGSVSGEDMNGLLSSLFGGMTMETVDSTAVDSTAADSTAADSTAADSTAADSAAADSTAAGETATVSQAEADQAAAELAALVSMFKETKDLTYSKPESADAFYGTWVMKSIVLAGYEMDLAAMEQEGKEEMPAMILKLSEEVYDLFEAGAEPAPKAVTASELKDGELTISYYSEGKLTKETFRMTEAGELCLIQTAEEGGSESAPTYILFTKAAA